MSDWWPLAAAFWGWFFFDFLRAANRGRFLFSSWRGGARVAVQHGLLRVHLPTPLAWQVEVDDAPFSFSPQGVTNLPSGSAGRPGPNPERLQSWRWEEIDNVAERGGAIFINGKRFCPRTNFARADTFRAWVARLKQQPETERSALLRAAIAVWFRPTALCREIARFRGRTRLLAAINTIAALFALSGTVYLVWGSALGLAARWSAWVDRSWPILAAEYGLLHAAALVLAWRTHRRLSPSKSEERLNTMLTAFLLPPFALRLRGTVAADTFTAFHPLTWLLAAVKGDARTRYLRQLVADLRWPALPARQPATELPLSIAAWMRLEMEAQVSRLLTRAGISIEDLLAAPKPDGSASCQYCPRCGSQFVSGPRACPRGIPLRALERVREHALK